MEVRVAQGRAETGFARSDPDWLDRLPATFIGAALVAVAVAAYWLPGSVRYYNHFVWQAMAFLGGQAAIQWPAPGNDPMYLANKAENNSRVSYYGVTYVPFSVLDGNYYSGSANGNFFRRAWMK